MGQHHQNERYRAEEDAFVLRHLGQFMAAGPTLADLKALEMQHGGRLHPTRVEIQEQALPKVGTVRDFILFCRGSGAFPACWNNLDKLFGMKEVTLADLRELELQARGNPKFSRSLRERGFALVKTAADFLHLMTPVSHKDYSDYERARNSQELFNAKSDLFFALGPTAAEAIALRNVIEPPWEMDIKFVRRALPLVKTADEFLSLTHIGRKEYYDNKKYDHQMDEIVMEHMAQFLALNPTLEQSGRLIRENLVSMKEKAYLSLLRVAKSEREWGKLKWLARAPESPGWCARLFYSLGLVR